PNACQSVALTPSSGSVHVGQSVTLTATASGCGHADPKLTFLSYSPSTGWQIIGSVTASGTSGTFAVTPSSAGTDYYGVWALDSHSVNEFYDTYAMTSVAAAVNACSGVSLAVSSSSVAAGSSDQLTATVQGGCSAVYAFEVYVPGTGPHAGWGWWNPTTQSVQPSFPGYVPAASFDAAAASPTQAVLDWQVTTGTPPGGWWWYAFAVDSAQAGGVVASSGHEVDVQVPQECTSASVSLSPASSSYTWEIGSTLTVQGSASGASGGCTSPQYWFQLYNPSVGWVTWTPTGYQDGASPYWTSTSSVAWNTTGLSPSGGPDHTAYEWQVQVRDAATTSQRPVANDVGPINLVAEQPCQSVSLGLTKYTAGPVKAGDQVTVTPTATGCTNATTGEHPEYVVWVHDPSDTSAVGYNNGWVPIYPTQSAGSTSYGTGPVTYTVPAGAITQNSDGTYDVYFFVWARGSGSTTAVEAYTSNGIAASL
ncbi:MAG: hypothetical protein M0Z63_11275, partial [Actinomycetota bacterium]|nr:hypothetical protein [Actinomycetota bacterium]